VSPEDRNEKVEREARKGSIMSTGSVVALIDCLDSTTGKPLEALPPDEPPNVVVPRWLKETFREIPGTSWQLNFVLVIVEGPTARAAIAEVQRRAEALGVHVGFNRCSWVAASELTGSMETREDTVGGPPAG